MSCLAMSLTLISAFMPVPPAAADPSPPPPPPVVVQTAPEPVAPPPPPYTTPPPQASVSAAPAPAPGYVVSPPPATGAWAPQLKGPSVWGILPYSYYGTTGLGVGARFMVPLAIPPLLKNTTVRDGFAIEFGADYLHWSFNDFLGSDYSVNWFLPVASIMWNVWLNDKIVLYPKFALGYEVVWLSGPYTGGAYGSSLFWDFVAGAMYKLDNGLTLRAELGYAGLKAGVGWLF